MIRQYKYDLSWISLNSFFKFFSEMKSIIALLLLVAIACASPYNDYTFLARFNAYQVKYNKIYQNVNELHRRREIFRDNQDVIDRHNERYAAGLETYQMGVNQFTDLLPSEFENLMLSKVDTSSLTVGVKYTFTPDEDVELPASVDWRTKGAVTPVKNQGSCGSCWAFSAIGALEGSYFLKTNKLVSLSEQNLVDCSENDYGCNGGWPATALQYIKDNGGVDTEASYPYEGKDGICRFNKDHIGATVSNIVGVLSGNESALAAAVASDGPISVAIDASDFQHYSSGVFNVPSCKGPVDHGVVVVGYGNDATGGDYWLVKNSWGASWGENGYIKMSRGRKNQCLIASYPVKAVV